nr:hypothetical protein [Nonomuraea deserti]
MHAMPVQAEAAPGMALDAAMVDADPYVLCTPAGVADLRTGARPGPEPARTADPFCWRSCSNYSVIMPMRPRPGFLMAKACNEHPTDLSELHGRRVIACSELKPGDRFDEAPVKLLTGGDKIKARRMRHDCFGSDPSHPPPEQSVPKGAACTP